METLFALLVIREGNPPVTSGPHRKEQVIFSMVREKAVDQAVELYFIWDTAKLMSRYSIHVPGWLQKWVFENCQLEKSHRKINYIMTTEYIILVKKSTFHLHISPFLLNCLENTLKLQFDRYVTAFKFLT